jgi:hypothetical protein
VIAEGSALGSQAEAAEGVPRHGTGQPGVGFSVSAMSGVQWGDCLGGCTGQSGRARQLWGAERGRALDGVGWDRCERCAEWCGPRNGVVSC